MADLFKQANKYLDDGDVQQAMDTAAQALEKFQAAGDADGIIDVVKTLVAAHIAVEKIPAAKDIVKNVQERFRANGNSMGQAFALLAIAELSCADEDADGALSVVTQIRGLLPSVRSKGREIETQLLNMQVNAYMLKGSATDAMSVSKELRALAQKNADKTGEANAWHAIASVHSMMEHQSDDRSVPEDVLQAADKALVLYRELGDKKGEATTLNTQAKALLRMEKASQGLKVATESLGVWRELGQTRGMVSALDTIVSAHSMQDNPMAGLNAANKELTLIRRSGNRRGEADLLEMISNTHIMLGEPRGALAASKQALDLYTALADDLGMGNMCYTMSEAHRSLGDMQEATRSAEKSLAHYKAAGSKWGQEQALQTLSSLLVTRGAPEKAPKRADVAKSLKELAKAVESRSVDDVSAAENKLSSMGNLVADGDIQNALVPLFQKDAGAMEFLEEQGWQFDKPKGDSTIIKQYPHKGFYLHTALTGMGFGPQFRSVHPHRVGQPGEKVCAAVSVTQLPQTEAWQMEMGFRPAYLDAGLQVGNCYNFD